METIRTLLSIFTLAGNQQETRKRKHSPSGVLVSGGGALEPRVVLEGWMDAREDRSPNWKHEYFVLREDGSLRSFAYRPCSGKNPDPLEEFNVQGCQISNLEKPRRYTFVIHDARQSRAIDRMFSASSDRVRAKWVQVIQTVDCQLRHRAAMSGRTSSSDSDRDHIAQKVGFDDFEVLKMLGKGSYGKVVLARERFSSQLCAMKVIMKKTVASEGALTRTVAESRVIRSTAHPFIIDLKYAFQTTDALCLVLDFVPGGDLFFHLTNGKSFSEERARFYGAEIVLALEYLHGKGIIHRDLKTENILLDRHGHVKLTDFGLSKDGMAPGATTNTMCGTPEYMAPEILSAEPYDFAVDWWGLGAIMYDMMCGQVPYFCPEDDPSSLLDIIRSCNVTFPVPLSDNAKSLILGLLRKNPKMRLGGGERGAKGVKEHPFFEGISWRRLLWKRVTPPFRPYITSEDDTRNFDLSSCRDSSEETADASASGSWGTRHFAGFSFYGDSDDEKHICTRSCKRLHKRPRMSA